MAAQKIEPEVLAQALKELSREDLERFALVSNQLVSDLATRCISPNLLELGITPEEAGKAQSLFIKVRSRCQELDRERN